MSSSSNGSEIRFGTYVEFQCPQGRDHGELIEDVIRLGEHADECGYHVFATVEHPFNQEFSVNPNPLALFSAMAERTRNIRFRTLCLTLPLHNPMVLAGEVAQADVLTKGRIECGVGRGHAWLCEDASVVMEESVGRHKESLDILLKGWTEDRFSYDGEYYQCKDVAIVPKPYQQPHPKIFVVGTSSKWFKMAAENGWGTNVGGPAPDFVFQEAADLYLDECRIAGTHPQMGYAKAMFIADDEKTALEECRQWVKNYIDFNVSPMDRLARDTDAEKKRLEDAGYAFYARDDFYKLRELSVDELLENEIVYVGTPSTVIDKCLDLYARFRFQELLLIAHYGGMPRWQALRTQELFAREVMPALREEIPKIDR